MTPIIKTSDPISFDLMKEIVEKLIQSGRKREALIMATPSYMMLRFSDWSKLTWNILNLDRVILLEQKTLNTRKVKKPRSIKLSDDFKAILKRCKPDDVNNDTLLIGNSLNAPISIQYINTILKNLKDEFSIPAEHFSTHSLIKSGCLALYEKGGRSEAAMAMISKLRGHATILTTMTYLGFTQKMFDEAYESL